VTEHVVSLVPFQAKAEANYFCALMNSSVASYINASYSTSKSYGTDHVNIHSVSLP
jgi:hypothetical protein